MKLIHGDCLLESEQIENGSVDLILTDLPYGTVTGIGCSDLIKHGMKGRTSWDFAIDPTKVFEIANRILRKNGKMVLFSQEPYTSRLITQAIANVPFSYRMVWEKDHFANSLLANKAPVSYFEDILVFSKSNHGTIGDNDEYRKYLNSERKKAKLTLDQMCGVCGLNTKGHGGAAYHWCSSLQPSLIPEKHYNTLNQKTGFFNKKYEELKQMHSESFAKYASTFNLWEGGKYKSNILKYKKDYDGYHPTQKPVLLLEDLVKTFSNEGNLVVDLTMGSGSTGVACVNTKRDFIGIEKDEGYFKIAQTRIQDAQSQGVLL
jgi:DNA modification methylase